MFAFLCNDGIVCYAQAGSSNSIDGEDDHFKERTNGGDYAPPVEIPRSETIRDDASDEDGDNDDASPPAAGETSGEQQRHYPAFAGKSAGKSNSPDQHQVHRGSSAPKKNPQLEVSHGDTSSCQTPNFVEGNHGGTATKDGHPGALDGGGGDGGGIPTDTNFSAGLSYRYARRAFLLLRASVYLPASYADYNTARILLQL